MKNLHAQFGDITRFTVMLNGKDITEAVANVYISQELTNPFTTAVLDIADTTNMITRYNIRPNAKVDIKLNIKQEVDTDDNVHLSFVVISLEDKRQINHKAMSYTLNCTTKEYLANQNAKVCEAFDGKRPDEIVKQVVQKHLHAQVKDEKPKPEQLDSSVPYHIKDGKRLPSRADNEMVYIATNISPLTVVAEMCKVALHNNQADFVFYTKTIKKGQAKLCFESLSTLWQRKPHVKFIQRPNNIRENGDTKSNKNLEFTTWAIDHFNALVNVASGYDANQVATFDFVNKKWETEDKKRKGGQKIGKPEALIHFMPKHEKMFDGGESTLDKGVEWFSSRRHSLFKLEQNRIRLQLTGNTKAFNWLSEIAELDMPANDSLSEQNLDSRYKGKYLITAVGHIITKSSYFVNVELCNWEK